MQRLERSNPVKPSVTSKPLNRARQAGELAAERLTSTQEQEEPTPEALDARMDAAARKSLKEFRELLEEQQGDKPPAKRAPDSQRRKKLKKQRRREKESHRKHDDADRDSNHAIAHEVPGVTDNQQCDASPEDRFGPRTGGSDRLALESGGIWEPARIPRTVPLPQDWATGFIEGFPAGVTVMAVCYCCNRRRAWRNTPPPERAELRTKPPGYKAPPADFGVPLRAKAKPGPQPPNYGAGRTWDGDVSPSDSGP